MGESSRGRSMALRLLCLTVSLGLTSSDSQRLSSGLISESTQKCSTQEPAIGDIMVRDRDGAVTVYYTDGMHRPQWMPICTSDAGFSVLTVICRQFGYQKANSLPGPLGPGTHSNTLTKHGKQVFTTLDETSLEVNCGSESVPHSHILQCDYSVSDTCMSQDHLQNSTFTCERPLNTYSGQVYLCPPNGFPAGKCSVSTGLVRIWAYDEWRGINQNSSKSPLGSRVADSICRQLGYTNAVVNSAVTLNATFSYLTYNHCYYTSITAQALVTTDQLSCNDSHNCLGCCFRRYPKDQGDFCSECRNITDIVLSCTFDPTISNSRESSNCTFGGLTCHGGPQHKGITLVPLLAGLSGSLGLLMIVATFILVIIIIIYCYRTQCCRRQAVQQQGANPNGARGQGQP